MGESISLNWLNHIRTKRSL